MALIAQLWVNFSYDQFGKNATEQTSKCYCYLKLYYRVCGKLFIYSFLVAVLEKPGQVELSTSHCSTVSTGLVGPAMKQKHNTGQSKWHST